MDNDDHNFYNAHPPPTALSAGYEPSSDYILDDDDDHDHDHYHNSHAQDHDFPSTTSRQSPHLHNLSTSFEQYASNASVNGFTSEPPDIANSPDPHDFYRQYRDPYRRGLEEDLAYSDSNFGDGDDEMTTSRAHRSIPTNGRPKGYTSSPLSSRYNNRSEPHTTSSPLAERVTKAVDPSNPQLPRTTRNRQTSLQALVNKFNQNLDEVPPIPSKPGSRSTSANASPATIHGPKTFRSRVPSETPGSGHKMFMRATPSASDRSEPMTLQSPRKRIAKEAPNSNPMTIPSPRNSRKPPSVSSTSYASQSMTDLNVKKPEIPQRPLFGEVLAVNTASVDPGYRIPVPRRRRGSEGSMHTPNPMFSEDRSTSVSRVSPSSPTAWYLGVTPSLEGINLDKPIPARPSGGMHRRSRSDFAGTISKPPHSSCFGKSVTIMSPPQEQSSPLTSPLTAKRNSQSRIPISTRRMSVTSDSGNSSQSTRSNSIVNQSAIHRRPSAKAGSVLANPRSSTKLSNPDRKATASPSKRSPRHRNLSPLRQQTGTSPRLKAYISEPQPMKSPPLRSSRPRQPVSTATTSASRARAAERAAMNASRNSSGSRDAKQKKLPELGGVDFAARRQRIQQAFTKTMEENKRKTEIEAEKQREAPSQEPHQEQDAEKESMETRPETDTELPGKRDLETPMIKGSLSEKSPLEKTPKSERDLTINTAPLFERSVLDLSQEDSPTLGVANRFLSSRQFQYDSPTPPSEDEPMSAVTAGTAETFFDNEPQEETPAPNRDHRTLLSQVMGLREPSPAELDDSVNAKQLSVQVDDSASDRDDRESIQIMLGATPINETAADRSALQVDETRNETCNPDSRWSTNSWTSMEGSSHRPSLDQAREANASMDRIDELTPPRQEGSGHVSMSTNASTYSQPMWSPDSMSSLLSGRTTLDSDSYNTINRVLDSYHDSNQMTPETISDIQQRLFSQSPDIARRGGWDTQKVTKLYLQALGKTSYAQPSVVPEPLNVPGRTSGDSARPPPPAQRDHADMQTADIDREKGSDTGGDRCDESDSHEPLVAEGLEVVDRPNPQRASLNHPDDFTNTSPSLLDWMHRAEAETPTEDNTLLSPRKYRGPGGTPVYEQSDAVEPDRSRTPRVRPEDSQVGLPDIPRTGGGLGILDINVESPHDESFPPEPHPPIPGESTSSPIHSSTIRKNLPSSPSRKSPPPPPIIYSRHQLPGMSATPDSSVPQPGTAKIFPSSSEALSTSKEVSNGEGASVSTEPASKSTSPPPDQKRLTRRRHIIKELVDTESSFGQDMKVVDDIYKGTSNIIVISQEDVKILFGNSEQIVAFSTSFLDALKQAVKSVYVLPKSRRWRSQRDSAATSTSGNTDDQSSLNGAMDLSDDEMDRKTTIGEAFGNHMTQMEKVYAEYLKNHDSANQKLVALQKNDKVKIWLKECQLYASDLTTAWDLDSLLVKPVQRILKYPLLLKELLEVTPVNHPDFAALDNAAREMVGVSVRINEMKKRAEQFEQATNSGRKRKDFDPSKKLKIKFPTKVPENVQDKEYDKLAEKFGSQFFQLQLVMRDVDDYSRVWLIRWTNSWGEMVAAIEAYIDVKQSPYPEVESKYRNLRMSTREIMNTALTDHVSLSIQQSDIQSRLTSCRSAQFAKAFSSQ